MEHCIGRGSEGVVYAGEDTVTHQPVAVKVSPIHDISYASLTTAKKLGLKCPNVVEILNLQMDQKFCYIVMEKCDKDLLVALTESGNRLSEYEAANIFIQIIRGIEFCNSHGVFHGDLKPENVLLRNGIVKLADFSFGLFPSADLANSSHSLASKASTSSTVLSSRSSSQISLNTAGYASPEICLEPCLNFFSSSSVSNALTDSHAMTLKEQLSAMDVWSAGVTLFVICAGYSPWSEATIENVDYREYIEKPSSIFPQWFSGDLRDLLLSMLVPDPSKRAKFHNIRNHQWIVTSTNTIASQYLEPSSSFHSEIKDSSPLASTSTSVIEEPVAHFNPRKKRSVPQPPEEVELVLAAHLLDDYENNKDQLKRTRSNSYSFESISSIVSRSISPFAFTSSSMVSSGLTYEDVILFESKAKRSKTKNKGNAVCKRLQSPMAIVVPISLVKRREEISKNRLTSAAKIFRKSSPNAKKNRRLF